MATVRHRVLSPAQQALGLKARFPRGTLTVRPTTMVWTGTLRPTPLSRNYTVRVTYTCGWYPKVWVLDPPLKTRPGEPLPHTYRDGSLCLHEAHDWTASMLLVHTVIPWAVEWLAHYELWKATGLWYGDSERGAALVVAPADEQNLSRAERRGTHRSSSPRVRHR